MSDYTQDGRRCGVSTSLGKDTLLLNSFEGQEPMSGLYSYELQLLSESDQIQAPSVVAKPIVFWVEHPDAEKRFFHGFVNRFEYVGRADRLSVYRAHVVPLLWFLSQNSDCRIFQDMTVPEIIQAVFASRKFTAYEDSFVRGSHSKLEYCVQYNESDFAFVSRLMEYAGINYFFRHEEGQHTMVLADTTSACNKCKDGAVVFDDNLNERTAENEIWEWEHRYEFRAGKWTHRDYNFKEPTTDMESFQPTTMQLPMVDQIEKYEYPGGYELKDVGTSFAEVRIQAEEAQHDVVNGASSCRSFSPGGKFSLAKHHSSREKGKGYIITSVQHSMQAAAEFVTGGSSAVDGYKNNFTCVPEETKIRPLRVTHRPRVNGPQTAVVVGPAGEEIETDEFGRVKVQFHWDRIGQFDQNSSCWIRVSQVHAGQGWGMMDLPRIGEEVIVSFLEGDPDRPIITGRVYNGQNPVPFNLPAEKTRRGNSTKTYKGGGYNEMSMDDTPGKEQLRMNAQYDMNSNVNNDQTLDVGNDRSGTIGNDESWTVGNDQATSVANNRSLEVGVSHNEVVGANHSEAVGVNHSQSVGANQSVVVGSNQTTSVGSNQTQAVGANRTVTVGANETTGIGIARTVGVGMLTNHHTALIEMRNAGLVENINAGVMTVISAGVQLQLIGPGGQISIGPSGIHIKGKMVTIEGGVVNINP